MKPKNKLRYMIIAALIAAVMVPVTAGAVYAENVAQPSVSIGIEKIKDCYSSDDPGSVVFGGHDWYVISYPMGSANPVQGTATFLSVGNMDYSIYGSDVNEYSRSHLKMKTDALTDIFTADEKAAIITKTLVSSGYNGPETDGVAGDEVEDALLWPLSTKEADAVQYKFLPVDPEHPTWQSSYWWLRSPGSTQRTAAVVLGSGFVQHDGYPMHGDFGVRPAFYLETGDIILTSAAEGGKTCEYVGANSMTAVPATTSNRWKLTLRDSSHSGFKAGTTDEAVLEQDKGYSDWYIPITYSGAKTGDREFVSAILCDDNGKACFYGNIDSGSTRATVASGISVMIPKGLDIGSYTLYIFNEQVNGDNRTDFGSDLSAIDLKVTDPGGDSYPPKQVSIKGAKVVLSSTSYTYNGKVRKPSVKTIDGMKLNPKTDYTITIKNSKGKTVKSPKAAGSYTVVITGKGKYTGQTKASYKIKKAANPLTIKAKTATVNYKKLKKKTQSLSAPKVINFKKQGQGKMSYKKTCGSKKILINKKTGAVTVKKGLKKGTYKVTVKVKAAGNSNYKASATKKITFKIRVR